MPGGPGPTLTFGSPNGPLDLRPGQWAVIHADGRITVGETFDGEVTPLPDGPECNHHFAAGALDHAYACTCDGQSAEAKSDTYDDELAV